MLTKIGRSNYQTLKNIGVQEKAPLALGEIGLDYFRLPKDCELAEKNYFLAKKPCGSNLVLPVNSIVR